MVIRRASTLVWAAALQFVFLTATATAQARPEVVYGPFAPNVSIGDAVAAQPGMGWRTIRHRKTNEVVQVVADRPLRFAELNWRLTLGDSVAARSLANAYSFDLRSELSAEGVGACLLQFSHVMSTLEGMYGAFGQHPAFSQDGKGVSAPLYQDLEPFNVRRIGDRSVLRDYGDGNYTTFFEVDEATGEAVSAEAKYFPADRACSLRIHAFQDKDRIRRAQASRARYEGREDRDP
ncbi:hypothetical protein [Phenylobacterium sp.]|jgi:hypothetical protein|uniref:hypothetical protein n=1 Tax=Phenylobacterium sp. TaxID=1871053 RepID=UPI002E342878|nr:hypothetical protein [Phenylobacterium sp.]HEX4712339.1 hypothetical protein [Phenylobacterium sp.]